VREHPAPLSKESREGIGGAKRSGARDKGGRWWGSLGFRHGPIFLMARAARDIEGMLPCTLTAVCDAPWRGRAGPTRFSGPGTAAQSPGASGGMVGASLG